MNTTPPEMFTTYSNGKLLLSGEYMVLKGAWALAIPLRFGQKFQVSIQNGLPSIHWESISNGQKWVRANFSYPSLDILETDNPPIAKQIRNILLEARKLQPTFLASPQQLSIEATLNFPYDWGIGSSSSFIVNIARWAGCDPFELNQRIFSGSGYDIAAASSDQPILYRINQSVPVWKAVTFNPPYIGQLWLVYRNKKQNTLQSIRNFQKIAVPENAIHTISSISLQMAQAPSLDEFMTLMNIHENLMAEILQTDTLQQTLFSDFRGTIKSLGAWGGDFFLAASNENDGYVPDYFKAQGFETYFQMNEMILK